MSAVVILAEERLREIIREELRAAASSATDDWMNAEEVARMLNVERGTIPALVSRNGLPCYRPGKSYTFRRSEVEAWLASRPRGSRKRSKSGRVVPFQRGA